MKCIKFCFLFNIQLFFLLFRIINNFFVLPFDTIYIDDETIKGKDYHTLLFQNELYVNLSMGTPKQHLKAMLKMDKYGFIIYEDAFNYNLSSTFEKSDKIIKISWVWSFIPIPSNDHFYLPSFNSYKEFQKYIIQNNKKEFIYNITKTNKTLYLGIHIKNKTSNNFNKMFHNYGIIGLQFNANINFNAPEFVTSLKESNEINSYTFSLKFNNETNKGFFNNENNGYFIIGEELTDDINEKNKITYTNALKFGGEINWETLFDNIYLKSNDKYISFNSKRKQGDFFINKPYILGSKEYNEYINKTFFNELIEQNICHINDKINNNDYFSYICDSNSPIFINNLNNKFPDLVFEHKELEENFTLTKNDLFTFNHFNKSDNNLYFLIMFANPKGHQYIFSWMLGIPFLKKYRISFNYDTKKIGYYKNDGKIIISDKNETNNFNIFKSTFFKIVFIIILIIIIFILGMFYQRKINKVPRKNKANELDDDYEYESSKNNNDINNFNNKKHHKEVELGIKLI